MNIPRMLGIAIVMIVPSFVGSGILWNIFHNPIPIIIWVLIMFGTLGAIISKQISKEKVNKAL